ncbi:hypothetical protein GTR02_08945 [Kineococcus sp. R8]|nr:hypothetical protein [Kineococcus siccus]
MGDDDPGRRVREDLEREGVVLDWLTVGPGPTARSCVLVTAGTGRRAIAAQPAPAPDPADVPLTAATWLHVDQTGARPVRRALAGRHDGPRLSVDGGNPLDPGDFADLAGVDVYAPSVLQLCLRYGTPSVPVALSRAVADGARWVVATDGDRGAHVRSADVDEHVAAHRVDVTSTLGAGDVFHGALLAGLVAGAALPAAVRRASAAAALSCRGVDGRSAIPSAAELDAYLDRERPSAPAAVARRLECS